MEFLLKSLRLEIIIDFLNSLNEMSYRLLDPQDPLDQRASYFIRPFNEPDIRPLVVAPTVPYAGELHPESRSYEDWEVDEPIPSRSDIIALATRASSLGARQNVLKRRRLERKEEMRKEEEEEEMDDGSRAAWMPTAPAPFPYRQPHYIPASAPPSGNTSDFENDIAQQTVGEQLREKRMNALFGGGGDDDGGKKKKKKKKNVQFEY